MMIRWIYRLVPMWVWEVVILMSMIGMFLIMCFIGLIILDLLGAEKHE